MKKINNRIALIIAAFAVMISASGCWNYKDVNEISIAICMAIDKNPQNNKYISTIEFVHPSGGKEARMEPSVISSEGDTMFDSVRNMIAIKGKKAYWSHAKGVIISEDIAREGIVKVLDFIDRDAETRADLWLLVSSEKTAREILHGEGKEHDAMGFHLDDQFKNAKSVSKYPAVELYKFIHDISDEGISPILPAAVMTKGEKDEIIPEIYGAAVFKKDKMVGLLDQIETRSVLFVKNELKGGVVSELNEIGENTNVALEIINSKTKVKPVLMNEKLSMKIDIEIDANIGEIAGSKDVIDEEGREMLIKKAENSIQNQIQGVIGKVQKEFESDIFGFGRTIYWEMPALWKQLKTDWNDIFIDLNTEVNVKLNIKGSALTYKPIKIGD